MFGLMKKEIIQESGMTEKQFKKLVEFMQPMFIEGVKIAMEDTKQATNQMLKNQEDTKERIALIDEKIEGEYITPQDEYAIDFAIESKAKAFLKKQGTQITLETLIAEVGIDIYEQVRRVDNANKQYNNDLGRMKAKILVQTRKFLGMKGNAPKRRIKRKDVDRAIQFIKDLRHSDIA